MLPVVFKVLPLGIAAPTSYLQKASSPVCPSSPVITKFFTCRQLPLPLLLWAPVSQSQTMLICNRCRLTHACLNVRSSSKGQLPRFSGVPKAIHGPRSFGWKEAQISSGNAWLDGMNSSGFWFVMPLTYPLINKASCTTLPNRVLRLSFRLGLTYRLL